MREHYLSLRIPYVAGLFDGEGSYTYCHYKKENKLYSYPRLSLGNTEKNLVDNVEDLFKVLNLECSRVAYQPKYKNAKRMYYIYIYQYESLQRFFEIFGFYLIRLNAVRIAEDTKMETSEK